VIGMSEWGASMDDGERRRPFYRKGIKIAWHDPEAVKAYRREWWRSRRALVSATRRKLRQKWAEMHGLPSDRLRAMREFAREEAIRRGVEPAVVYREWGCMTPAEIEKLGDK
jgi:hypothetical protein